VTLLLELAFASLTTTALIAISNVKLLLAFAMQVDQCGGFVWFKWQKVTSKDCNWPYYINVTHAIELDWSSNLKSES
jgi:hypothetical protein